METNANYDKLIDGFNAVRNAAMRGVLPGGGAALLHASKLFEFCDYENLDEKMGGQVMAMACREPFLNILENAGIAGGVYLDQLLSTNNWRMGFDVWQHQVTDMIDAGVG